MRPATTAKGMTTAMAILPVLLSPPESPGPSLPVIRAEGEDDDEVEVLGEEVVDGGGGCDGGRVDVTTTIEGA